jgi:rare lipoprotein A (peptidoglycan hydrolase)
MLTKLFLQYTFAIAFGVGVDDGYATLYGTPDDKYKGGPLACEGREIPQDEPLCAHRWLPCGTKIVVINLERKARVTTCRVADRGPYGVDRATNRWRGILDLTPHAAKAARLDGRDFVRLIYMIPQPGARAYEETRWLAPVRGKRAKEAL